MKNKNVFEEVVKTLKEDSLSLQKRFHALQEKNDIKGSIDCLRLLKDTLSLIRDYDWELKYSEYETDGYKEVAVWEQNHCGDIRGYKKWIVESENQWNVRVDTTALFYIGEYTKGVYYGI